MPLVTSALVRWAGGWSEVTNPTAVAAHGRVEGLLGLGALSSPAEVLRVADAQLATFGNPREEINAGIEPVDTTDTPYLAFRPGDVVTVPDSTGTPTAERVVAMTVSVDDATGRVIFTPTLRDRLLDQSVRLAQATKKMINGTFGGASQVAQPVVPVAKPNGFLPGLPATPCLVESFDGADSTTVIGHDHAWSRHLFADAIDHYADAGGFVNVGNTAALEVATYGVVALLASARCDVDISPDMVVSVAVARFDDAAFVTFGNVGVIARADPADVWHTNGYTGGLGCWDWTVQWDGAQLRGSLALVQAGSQYQVEWSPGVSTIDLGTSPIAPGDVVAVHVTGTGTATVLSCYWRGTLVGTLEGGLLATNQLNWGHLTLPEGGAGSRAGFGIGGDPMTDFAIEVDNFSACPG